MESVSNPSFTHLYMKLMNLPILVMYKDDLRDTISCFLSINYDRRMPEITQSLCSEMSIRLVEILKLFNYQGQTSLNVYYLIVCISNKQKLNVFSSSVNIILHNLQTAWFNIMTQSANSSAKEDSPFLLPLLDAVSSVCYGNGAYISGGLLDWLVSTERNSNSIATLIISTSNFQIRKVGLQCLKGLCIPTNSQERLNSSAMANCYNVFYHIMKIYPSLSEVSMYSLMFTTLRGIKHILETPSFSLQSDISDVLIVLKKVCSFGLPPSTKFSMANLMSALSDVPQGAPPSPEVSSGSESDFSDSELSKDPSRKKFATKLRQLSIDCIFHIVKKTSKNALFSYWQLLIHDIHGTSLLSCIKFDPVPKIRSTSLMILNNLLECARSYLSMAIQENRASSSFVSFSSKLVTSIKEIHKCLVEVLSCETSLVVQNHVLKALATLAANTPYSKMEEGLITLLIGKAKDIFLSSSNMNSRIASLNIIFALVNNGPTQHEVLRNIAELKPQDDGSVSNEVVSSVLIETCYKICLSTTSSTMPLSISALQTLTAIAKTYFSVTKSFLQPSIKVTYQGFMLKNSCFVLHTCKLLEACGKGLSADLKQSPDILAITLQFWEALLPSNLQNLLSFKDSSINSQICDILATLGAPVYECLPAAKQTFCTSSLSKLVSNESYLVRSSAIRSLAMFVTYPTLRKQPIFVRNVSNAVLKLMPDEVKSVQSNAAWAFANLTDSLVINKEEAPEGKVDDAMLSSLFAAAIKVFPTKDKVRFNMMRVFGNLMRVTNAEQASNEKFIATILQAKAIILESLLKDSLMKVRWNACLALGNFLHNTHFPIGTPTWTKDVYESLCETISSSKNFKVRIKAAAALCCPVDRKHFGDQYYEVFCVLIRTLVKDSANAFPKGIAEDSKVDFQFDDKLQEQLLITLIYVLSKAQENDSVQIMPLFTQQSITFIKMVLRFYYGSNRPLDDVPEAEIQNQPYITLGAFTIKQKHDLLENASRVWQTLVKGSSTPPLINAQENLHDLFKLV